MNLDKAKIVFIGGAPRSGTTLLSELLDGHPQALVFPVELTMFPEFWRRNSDEREEFIRKAIFGPKGYQERMFVDEMYRKKRYEEKVKKCGRYLELDSDANTFLKIYNHQLDTSKPIFDRWLRALSAAVLEASPSIKATCKKPKILVFKLPYFTSLFADKLLFSITDMEIVTMIRHPIARYLSAKKRRLKKYRLLGEKAPRINFQDFVTGSCEITFSAQAMAKEKEQKHSNYKVIYFESLVSENERQMQNLAKYLGIDFDEVLLVPSRLGKPVTPTTSFWRDGYQKKIGVNPELAKYKKNFEKITNSAEKQWLEYVCSIGNLFSFYEFEKINSKKAKRAWNRPFKFERPQDYFRRLLNGCPVMLGEQIFQKQLWCRVPDLARKGIAELSGET